MNFSSNKKKCPFKNVYNRLIDFYEPIKFCPYIDVEDYCGDIENYPSYDDSWCMEKILQEIVLKREIKHLRHELEDCEERLKDSIEEADRGNYFLRLYGR